MWSTRALLYAAIYFPMLAGSCIPGHNRRLVGESGPLCLLFAVAFVYVGMWQDHERRSSDTGARVLRWPPLEGEVWWLACVGVVLTVFATLPLERMELDAFVWAGALVVYLRFAPSIADSLRWNFGRRGTRSLFELGGFFLGLVFISTLRPVEDGAAGVLRYLPVLAVPVGVGWGLHSLQRWIRTSYLDGDLLVLGRSLSLSTTTPHLLVAGASITSGLFGGPPMMILVLVALGLMTTRPGGEPVHRESTDAARLLAPLLLPLLGCVALHAFDPPPVANGVVASHATVGLYLRAMELGLPWLALVVAWVLDRRRGEKGFLPSLVIGAAVLLALALGAPGFHRELIEASGLAVEWTTVSWSFEPSGAVTWWSLDAGATLTAQAWFTLLLTSWIALRAWLTRPRGRPPLAPLLVAAVATLLIGAWATPRFGTAGVAWAASASVVAACFTEVVCARLARRRPAA